MIDSSLGQHQIQMAAIRQAISDGRLNAATLHQIMLDEISKELEKPLKEVDMDYVNTCDHLLELLNRDRNCMVDSFYNRNLTAIRKRMRRYKWYKSIRPIRVCIVTCITVLLIFGGIFVSQDNLDVSLSPDAEQLIIQGTEGNEATVSYADNQSYPFSSGDYDVQNRDEAVNVYGADPMRLTWLPNGWQQQHYSVDVIDAYRTINIIYQNDAINGVLVFQQTTAQDIDLLRMEIEQNDYGRKIETKNGLLVYITENYDMLTASWLENDVYCMIITTMSDDELLKCIESIEFQEEEVQ